MSADAIQAADRRLSQRLAGAPGGLGDIIDSVEDDKTASWFYTHSTATQRAIILGIQRQPGTNTIEVTDDSQEAAAAVPARSCRRRCTWTFCTTAPTPSASRTKTSQFTMLLTLGLVITVIFLFLRNVSATVIPSLALPFSIIGTFAVMYLLHYSLDNLSMMALILSVGFVVDDAIVMLENIFRHMEMGEKPLAASLVGSQEIGFTIVSMTLSLAAVFIPVLFMGGILGRLFREFAVTICVAILISGVVSVTLTPMLCSRFLRAPEQQQAIGWFYRITETILRRHAARLRRTLQVCCGIASLTMATFVLVLAGTVWHVHQDPQGLHSGSGYRSDLGDHRSAQGTSFYQMVEYQKQVADVVRRIPTWRR